MGEQSPINSVDIRVVSNGYILRYTRVDADPAPIMRSEEKVFVSWESMEAFLKSEGFVR